MERSFMGDTLEVLRIDCSPAILSATSIFVADADSVDPPEIVAINCLKLQNPDGTKHLVPMSGNWTNTSLGLPSEFRMAIVEVSAIEPGRFVFYHGIPESNHPGLKEVHIGVIYNVQLRRAFGYRIWPYGNDCLVAPVDIY